MGGAMNEAHAIAIKPHGLGGLNDAPHTTKRPEGRPGRSGTGSVFFDGDGAVLSDGLSECRQEDGTGVKLAEPLQKKLQFVSTEAGDCIPGQPLEQSSQDVAVFLAHCVVHHHAYIVSYPRGLVKVTHH